MLTFVNVKSIVSIIDNMNVNIKKIMLFSVRIMKEEKAIFFRNL